MFCKMSPPVECSVRRVRETCWVLGTLMVCECPSEPSASYVATWTDSSGNAFGIRELSDEEKSTSRTPGSEEAEADRVHHAGTSAAVWRFGDVFCKVKSWREGMEMEADTIAFVRQYAPSIPVPEVLCTWIDHEWSRSFTVIRAVSGNTLAQAWSSLTDLQRQRVATEVATFCAQLASITSPKLESAGGHGILDRFLTPKPPFSEPSWKPYLLGPFSSAELRTYLTKINPDIPIDLGDAFCYYHADLGPTNILVSEDGEISGIIDWESAGYYPRFWIGTKPLVSAGFYLAGTNLEEKKAWSTLFEAHLEAAGFESRLDEYKSWRTALGI